MRMAEKSPKAPADSAKSGWAAKQQNKGAAPTSGGAPKPQGGRPQVSAPQVVLSASGKEIRGIVRLAGRDLKGTFPMRRALSSIKGIGMNIGQLLAAIANRELKITDKTMIGELEEAQMQKLEQILAHPEQFGVPIYMLNRSREPISGETRHLIGTDLTYGVKTDIEHEKDVYTWRGYRHAYGQKVRGQHTRSTGRSGMTVGVMRKAILAKAGEAAKAGAAPAAGAPAPAGAKGAPAPKAAAPAAGAKPGAAPAAKAPGAKPAAGAKAPEKK